MRRTEFCNEPDQAHLQDQKEEPVCRTNFLLCVFYILFILIYLFSFTLLQLKEWEAQ